MSHTRIGVGLLGFGTVGSSVYEFLRQHADMISAKYDCSFEVRKVLVRNPKKKRRVALPARLATGDVKNVLNDETIDVVVEAVGGVDPTRKYLLEAIRARKHVVTANKELMANCGNRLVQKARQHGVFLGFRGAITGCHQFCEAIENSVMIESIEGVFNSTSNYILTEMADGLPFDEALAGAQARGYAEADPSNDVDGKDTVHKLVILATLAFGRFLDGRRIPTQGISHVTKEDVAFAKRLGYAVRLLGHAGEHGAGRIEAWVRPCLVPLDRGMGLVNGINNGIIVHDSLRGESGMIAHGAGGEATAMAIFTDLLAMARGANIVWPATANTNTVSSYVTSDSVPRCYFLRCLARNRPGVLATITKALGRHGINITHVDQRAGAAQQSPVPVLILCGPTSERELRRALKEAQAKPDILSDIHCFMVAEDS